ncbi:hypothetical protein T459_23971 [Capsicum annuum]|uniref:Ubiquitin-like protease family profile domain-containing protein n=1 Tax=Capsicum annuum TaxID=4072 RepID=A0A2G2YTW8_CAPAN|nr:hypothetical protein T459_23971 [Capsicum annuum]
MELFGATTITRKIILKGRLVVVDDGSSSGVAVGDNDAPLIVFEIISHYDYDHIGCTDFSPNFSTSSEYSACKCQDCRSKHDRVINAINALNASINKMSSKKGVIPSKRISYPYTPLEIKVAKRRRKDIFKASPSIEKSFSIPAGLPWYLVDQVYIPINCGDEFHWVLAVVILKKRRIRVYDSISRKRHSRPLPEIQKMAKILLTYLDMSGFLDQKVRTDWSTIKAYQDKMGNPFDVQYVEAIA